MSPLAIGPLIAFLGIIAAFAILRTKAQSKKSMYRSLRETRAGEIARARVRATEARAAQERGFIEKETADRIAAEEAERARLSGEQIAAAQAAATAEKTDRARLAGEKEAANRAAAAAQESDRAKAADEKAAGARAAAAAAAAAAPPVPISTSPLAPSEPVSTPPAKVPPGMVPPPPTPAEPTRPDWEVPAGAEAVPAAAPETPGTGKASWEIVEPSPVPTRAAEAAPAGPEKASWELDTTESKRDSKKKHQIADEFGDEDQEHESLAQTILSYAGLVAALLVILLGILFMVGARATS